MPTVSVSKAIACVCPGAMALHVRARQGLEVRHELWPGRTPAHHAVAVLRFRSSRNEPGNTGLHNGTRPDPQLDYSLISRTASSGRVETSKFSLIRLGALEVVRRAVPRWMAQASKTSPGSC